MDTMHSQSAELPIMVAIVEDEPEMRRRFEDAVRADPRLSWQFSAGTAAEAIDCTERRPADVYLVDLGLPDRDGRDFIRWLSRHQPETLAMVVTVFGDEEHVMSSLEAGAMGYLLKDSPGSEIGQRIVELSEGGSPISPSVARSMIRHFARAGAQPQSIGAADNPLSKRELEVLRLIEKGMTYDEVGQVLAITWHTVTTHLRRVYCKLQVGSRGEAVYEARQRGLI
jgi:DNA-binding NarL/FixJ family response regulator